MAEKSSHLRAEQNAWGEHDKNYFLPETELVVRCPHCNSLIDCSFLYSDNHECPNCYHSFTKSESRDIYIEAQQISVHGGWTSERLELLTRAKGPSTVSPAGRVKPVGDVARNLSAYAVAAQREALRVAHAKKRALGKIQKRTNAALGGEWKPPRPLA